MHRIIFILFLLFPALQSFTQGCSDAGLCSISTFKPTLPLHGDSIRHSHGYGINFGLGDHSVSSLSAYLSTSTGLLNKFGFDFKLSIAARSGNSISTFGFSDAIFMLNFKSDNHLIFNSGFKFRLGLGDKEYKDRPLPMDYQPSLGTNDLLLGIGYRSQGWNVTIGFQYPFLQNLNSFIPELWASDPILSSFVNTNQFKRKSDILLRIFHPIILSERLIVIPGLLPIYHLENDRYYVHQQGFKDIEGSKGLTLNATALFELSLKDKKKLGITIGFPLVVRDVRPDGLTRSFVIGVEYQRFSKERSYLFPSRKEKQE